MGLGKIMLFYIKLAYALVNIFVAGSFYIWYFYAICFFAAFY